MTKKRVKTDARAKPARPLCGVVKSTPYSSRLEASGGCVTKKRVKTDARAKPARPLCGVVKSTP